MSVTNLNVGGYKYITASGNVSNHSAAIIGIFVSSSTSGTITIYDDAATGTTTKAVDTITCVSGTYYSLPFTMGNGINIVVGGTLTATVAFA